MLNVNNINLLTNLKPMRRWDITADRGRMKKYSMLTLMILCCLSMMPQQKTINVNGVYYNLFDDGTAEVTNSLGGKPLANNRYSGNVIILPSVADNGNVYRVTKIGANAFGNSADLRSINIPNRIKVIGQAAFYYCTSLQNVTIPEGVEVIEESAFFMAENIITVSLPSTLREIGRMAFGLCHKLDNVTLPEGLKIINSKAFFDCWELHSINFPESVDSIQGAVFMATSIEKPIYNSRIFAYLPADYSDHYDVPYGIQVIAELAFSMARDLTSVSLPSSLKEIGPGAFGPCTQCWSNRYSHRDGYMGGCWRLTQITIPDGVTKIGSWAFNSCESLETVILPKSLTQIERGTFANCKNLTNVLIPSSVTKIGENAFVGCRKLIGMIVPNGVTNIGSDAFKGVPYIMYSGTASGRPWGAGTVCQ